jgi:dethiobiotin synthetase
VNGRWVAEDTLRLAEAAAWTGPLEHITPWIFSDPVAPSVAARRRGIALSLADLAGAVTALSSPGVPILVEGVGGLLCPVTDLHTVADLARVLGLPLVIVARRALGTLNHTLLTLEAARRRGLEVAGVVVNETVLPEGMADETNVVELRRLGVPILAVVPHQPGGVLRDWSALAEVNWWDLCQAQHTPRRCGEEGVRACLP